MTKRTDMDSFEPLTPAVFHIILALADGARHGYGIMLDVRRLSGGLMNLGPGTLYRSLQRMMRDGLIEEGEDVLDADWEDERRRYFRLTEFGKRVGRAEARRLAGLVDEARARKLLKPDRGARRRKLRT